METAAEEESQQTQQGGSASSITGGQRVHKSFFLKGVKNRPPYIRSIKIKNLDHPAGTRPKPIGPHPPLYAVVDLTTALGKLTRLLLHPLLQRSDRIETVLRSVVTHILTDLHGAEVGAAH